MCGDLKKNVALLTLEEKAALSTGKTYFDTNGVERLGIPSIKLADGPHGLRKQAGEEDHLGLHGSVPATCFPTLSGLGSSWNIDLVYRVGKALGVECQAENVAILLAPGINIKRSPLCGRNFEYVSEDPVLSGDMGAAIVNGIQSQGVGACVKHFAANNQETSRLNVSVEVDERTLREIYLTGFERVVKKAKPWSIMSAYNRINGIHCSQNKKLLTDILRDEWGFEGLVVSDWDAVDDLIESFKAGMDLEMPGNSGVSEQLIVDAVRSGQLDEAVLDRNVERYLTVLEKIRANKREHVKFDKEAHHRLAREAGRECVVLLKNEEGILPLNSKELRKIAVIGEFSKSPRYQGGGSSHVNATRLDNAYDEMLALAGDDVEIVYAQGYDIKSNAADMDLVRQAFEAASTADVAVLFVGLPESFDAEFYDRKHIDLPGNQLNLIEAVTEANPNVVVVLSNGAVVTLEPWHDKAKAILEGWLLGQAGGGAIADLLFGISSPSGKLAETIPFALRDTPAYLEFPGENEKVRYGEGVFVGYRYYDKKGMNVRYPFGHGLSYTTFEYSNLSIKRVDAARTVPVNVTVTIKNTGDCIGQEVVQLYVKDTESAVNRPERELKAFSKIQLAPGQETTVTFTLEQRDFSYYQERIRDWYFESGDFVIEVGSSSRDIRLSETISCVSAQPFSITYEPSTLIRDFMATPKGTKAIKPLLDKIQAFFGHFNANLSDFFDENSEIYHKEQMKNWRNIVGSTPMNRKFFSAKLTSDEVDAILKEMNA